MVEKKVHEKLRAKNEADITQEVQKLKEELKDLRNSKAANASSAKVARIKVPASPHVGHQKVNCSKPDNY